MSEFLRPQHYFDENHFGEERNSIFGKVWEFAGFRSDFTEDNQYKLIHRGGKEIILHHWKGAVRAFLNVCPHRFAKIHDEECGKRALLCPYHGWSFNGEGRLMGLPGAETFARGKGLREDVCLTSFQISSAGELLFVKLDPQGPDLKEYFGDRFDFVNGAGHAINKLLDKFDADIDVNWKVLIENSLEGYHVPIVHPTTIADFAGMSKKPEDIVNHNDSGNPKDPIHKRMHSFMINMADEKWHKRFSAIAKGAGQWPLSFNYYIHQLCFPNLTITSFLGYSFHIQHFEALSPTKSRVHSRIYSAYFEGGSEQMRNAIFDKMFEENIKFTHKVFKEDEGITAKVQAGLKFADPNSKPIFSSIESRIAAFQLTCLSYQANEVSL